MRRLIQTVIGLLLVTVTPPTHAAFMKLDRPGLAFPEGFREEAREEIQQVLEYADYHFLGGSAVNWNTTLRYGGSTKSLNLFLQSLATCSGACIRISFVASLPEEGEWYVHHSAREQGGFGFYIRINVGSERINLTELVVPEIRGEPNIEQDGAANPNLGR